MQWELKYTFSNKWYYDVDIDYAEVSILVDENFEDIFAYLFEQKYDTKYRETAWMLEKNAWDFYKELEQKWLNNQIDTYQLYRFDDKFKEYLKKLHEFEALQKAAQEVVIEYADEMYSSSDDEEYDWMY